MHKLILVLISTIIDGPLEVFHVLKGAKEFQDDKQIREVGKEENVVRKVNESR